jgi:hypothetical protein
MSLISVDLPDPLGPMMATFWPAGIRNERPLSTVRVSRTTNTSWKSISRSGWATGETMRAYLASMRESRLFGLAGGSARRESVELTSASGRGRASLRMRIISW